MEPIREYKSPIPKAAQYAEEVLEGKITLPSLKGQIPESWITEIKTILESKGYLIIEDSPEMTAHQAENSEFGFEEINTHLESAKNNFIDETNNLVETSANIGIDLPAELVDETKQETGFNEKIEDLKQEAGKEFNLTEKKQYEWDDSNHKVSVDIYNELMNVAKGAALGFNEDSIRKIDQYADEIKNGKSKQYVLDGLSKAMIDAVEKKLAETNGSAEPKTDQQKKTDQIEKFFDVDNKDIDAALEKKYQEYANRIINGESKEKVLDGLPPSMVQAIEVFLK